MNRRTIVGCLLALASLFGKGTWAQSAREEYRSTARQETVLQSNLLSIPGKEANVVRFELPANWVGGWHYHTGDVLVYVVEGEFVVDVQGEGRKRFGPGEVYHEAVNKPMQARNGSTRSATKLIMFQVGPKGEPLMFQAKPPGS